MSTTRLLVGTTKGAFILSGDDARSAWQVSGPHCGLWPINHVVGDPKTGALWAGGGNEWFGAGIWRSTDGGESWTLATLAGGQMAAWAADDPGFAEMIGGVPDTAPFTGDIDAIWSLGAANGKVYAGSKPAQLFVSTDGGESWNMVEGLANTPGRADWTPGAAGLNLHTIVPHPEDADRMWIGISAAGVFGTEDGGASWSRLTRRDNTQAHGHSDHPAAGSETETGYCVHNMVRAPGGDGDILYQQNHHGVFRSSDGGRSWRDITAGLPSTFGFPIRVHPRDPMTAWTIPLNGDMQGRFPPDGAAAVWKTTDGGETWTAKRDGLPQENCFFTVLRQAMAGDTADDAGVYFGTNSGSIYGSADEGETWSEIARHLPTILSVEVLETA
jgi:photosystem II stability/assembly factor-like uncharacterized protein